MLVRRGVLPDPLAVPVTGALHTIAYGSFLALCVTAGFVGGTLTVTASDTASAA